MAPSGKKSKGKTTLEDDPTISDDGSDADYIDEEGVDAGVNEHEDPSQGTGEEGQPKRKSGTTNSRGELYSDAANAAVLAGDLVWKMKPEPFEEVFKDREGKDWKVFESLIYEEIMAAKAHAPSLEKVDGDEVEVWEFEWRGHKVRWEKFVNIDWSKEKPFEHSSIRKRLEERRAPWEKKTPQASEKARQMALAAHYFEMKPKDKFTKITNNFSLPKENIDDVCAKIWSGTLEAQQERWSDYENKHDEIIKTKPTHEKGTRPKTLEEHLVLVIASWKGWGEIKEDRAWKNQKNKYAAENEGMLRRTPKDAIYIAVDQNDRLIIFLFPKAIQHAFKHESWVKERMETDTRHLYSHLKKPNPKGNKRHISENADPEEDDPRPHPGSEHYGHWHATGQQHIGIVETGDSHGASAIQRQAILHFLENTGGTMTKVLDFWFGVWEPELRERYRKVYEDSPKFARLPPTNKDYPETYCLRVVVCNRPTDEHNDKHDWRGGLTGLVHLGEFSGGQMCFNDLGIRCDGYGSGAILLLRGTEMEHFVGPYKGAYRYAFDHTTHESVRKRVEGMKAYQEYTKPDFSPAKPKKKQPPRRKAPKKEDKPKAELKSEEDPDEFKPAKEVKKKGKRAPAKPKGEKAPAAKKTKADAAESNTVAETNAGERGPSNSWNAINSKKRASKSHADVGGEEGEVAPGPKRTRRSPRKPS